ncbi:MAG: hypothetical protein AB1798_11290 [Spirochaetota bacterium]
MSKNHRGSGLREKLNHGRGKCPLCKRSGIKVVYEHDVKEKKVNICKQCRAALANGKMQAALAAL